MSKIWQNRPAEDVAWDQSERYATLFKICKVLHPVLLGLALIAIVMFLGQASHTPRGVLISGDGRAYRGQFERLRQDEAMFRTSVTDIIETLFLENEKGGVPDMEDFVDSRALAKYNTDFGPALQKHPNGFSQVLRVTELRIIKGRPTFADVCLRCELINRDHDHYMPTEIYLATQFQRGAPTDKNPLGWKLFGLKRMDHDQFFEGEINAKKMETLGVSQAPDSKNAKPVK